MVPFLPNGTNWSAAADRKSTRLNSSHVRISYAVFCLKKTKTAANPADSLQRSHELRPYPHSRLHAQTNSHPLEIRFSGCALCPLLPQPATDLHPSICR